MTVILLNCTFCGDVSLKPDSVWVTIYPDDSTTIEFDCPVCETPMERPSDQRINSLLLAVGCQMIPAPTIPPAVQEQIRRLRDSASYDRASAFRDQLEQVSTLADIGWVE